MWLLLDVLYWGLITFAILSALFVISLYIRGAFRWRALMHVKRAIAPSEPHFSLAIESLTKSLQANGNVIDFWATAKEIQQARLSAIESATESIQFETYIMTPGQRAQDFAAAVSRKAVEGVYVQLLVDSVGTWKMPRKYWHRMREAGVDVVFFNPFDWRAPANFAGRSHRKLLVIDGKKALIGGAGISDLWDGVEKSDDTQPWLDIELALEGQVVGMLSSVFQAHWQGHQQQNSRLSFQRSDRTTAIDMGKIRAVAGERVKNKGEIPRPESERSSTVLVTAGAKPSYRESSIERLKQMLIACARKRIWLSSPYFLPNQSTRHLIIEAKKAGVDVKVLTTSDRSDKKTVYYASYEVYGPLLEAGIEIYEYQPSMLHAKMLLIDDCWVNTGSANLDYRSFLHNDELDILSDSEFLANRVKQVFERGFEQSELVKLEDWQQRSWLKHRVLGNVTRLVQWQL